MVTSVADILSFKFLPPSTRIHFNFFFIFILSKLNIIPVLLYVQSYVFKLCNIFRFNFKQATKLVYDSGLENLQPCKAKIFNMNGDYTMQYVSKIPCKYGFEHILKLLLQISIILPWVSGTKTLMHQLSHIHTWRTSKYISLRLIGFFSRIQIDYQSNSLLCRNAVFMSIDSRIQWLDAIMAKAICRPSLDHVGESFLILPTSLPWKPFATSLALQTCLSLRFL